MYEVQNLVEISSQKLGETLSKDNLEEISKLAERYEVETLLKACANFCYENEEHLAVEEMEKLPDSVLVRCLLARKRKGELTKDVCKELNLFTEWENPIIAEADQFLTTRINSHGKLITLKGVAIYTGIGRYIVDIRMHYPSDLPSHYGCARDMESDMESDSESDMEPDIESASLIMSATIDAPEVLKKHIFMFPDPIILQGPGFHQIYIKFNKRCIVFNGRNSNHWIDNSDLDIYGVNGETPSIPILFYECA